MNEEFKILNVEARELEERIALPSIEIRNKFESIADSFNSQVACLNQKKDNLRKTRDLLLPKLISGQIDVENLDIDIGEIAKIASNLNEQTYS